MCIRDSNGTVCGLIIPDSFYVPNGEHRLISPQHWAQTLRKTTGDDNVSCITKWDKAICTWNNGKHTRTVPVDSQNVFTFQLATGYKKFTAFCTEFEINEMKNDDDPPILNDLCCQPVVPDQQKDNTNTTIDQLLKEHLHVT